MLIEKHVKLKNQRVDLARKAAQVKGDTWSSNKSSKTCNSNKDSGKGNTKTNGRKKKNDVSHLTQ